MTMEIRKYPRTSHIQGSRIQQGDEDRDSIPFAHISGRHLVIEEKVDGANSAVSFSATGELLLQSRGHYLTGGPRERHFNLLKQWASCHSQVLWKILEDRYLMFGEWLYAKHTIFYDSLPHFFLEFDIFDRHEQVFLSTTRRRALLLGSPVTSVPVIHEGVLSRYEDLLQLLGSSSFIGPNRQDALRTSCEETGARLDMATRETDMSGRMEGLYIKVEEDGGVAERYKWVRAEFAQFVDQSGSHWQTRPIIPNRLLAGVDLFSQ